MLITTLTLTFLMFQFSTVAAAYEDALLNQPADSSFRLFIQDPLARAFVHRALVSASERLTRPRCQMIFTEFRDRHGRPLAETLARLGPTPERYLRLIIFHDRTNGPLCASSSLAFTVPGSRVVYLCAQYFGTSWRNNSQHAEAALIHEMLHTLGLGENPPPSEDITHRILTLCAGN